MSDHKIDKQEKKKRIIYLLNSLQDEELRLYIKWRISEIILACQFFFSAYIILYIYLSYYSKSNYYWGFYSVIPIIHLFSTFALLFQRNGWSVEDTRTLLYCQCSDMMSALTSRKTNYRYFTTFLSIKILLFFYSVCVLMKPIFLYTDFVSPPTNSSSCTNEYLYSSPNTYNPQGFFNSRLNYTNSIQLKFCVMDRTWAWPNINTTVRGYTTSPLGMDGTMACNNPTTPFPPGPFYSRVNGYADANVCINKEGHTLSYPSPVLGLKPPITQGTQLALVFLCGGNTNDNVCVSPDGKQAYPSGTCGTLHRIGKPRKICPMCLNSWRRMAGDFTGPPGYEHCAPYDSTIWDNPFCTFCPGRGYGWLSDEVYTEDQLLTNLVLSSILTGLIIAEYGMCLVLVGVYIPEIKNAV